VKKRAILFAGQGAQVVGMGQDLYEASPEARGLYDQADAALGFSLSTISFRGPEEKLTDTSVCQPALYTHGLALLAVLKKEFPRFAFDAAAGLSLGEYTAHAAAGSFDFVTGLKLVQNRGRLMQEACQKTQGGMVSLIGSTVEQALEVAREADLDAANFNCPGQIVLSGPSAHIPAAVAAAQKSGLKRAIPLKVAGAYHSRLMAHAEEALRPFLESASISGPRVTVVANVTGEPVKTAEEIRASLARQVTGSVRWEACIRTLIAAGIQEFIELGPGGVLAGLLKRIDPAVPCLSIGTYAQLKDTLPKLA
jgi:[acyl-carrier-protein] S-malonyltransferase